MISVLLATFNGESYIKQSINSILNQTFLNFELLVGFNGTTDNSKEIVKSYSDKRIKVFDFKEDKGKAKTLNKLLAHSTGEWVCVQDDDDIWLPNKLEKQIKYFDMYDVIGTFIKYIDHNNNIIGQPHLSSTHSEIEFYSLNGQNQVANTSAVFKRRDAIDIGGWKEELDSLPEQGFQPCEDYNFWLRLLKNGKKFFNIPEYLVHHRMHQDSNFNTKKFDFNKIL